MIFTGHHEHGIDGKNRIAIPAKWRSRLDPERDGKGFYIAPGSPPTTIWLYTERHFESLAERFQSELIPDEDLLRFEQEFFPRADLVDVDSQGRVLIPEKMLKASGLEKKDVVVCGVRDHIEIRSRDEFEKQSADGWERFREYQLKARQTHQAFQRRVGKEPDAT